MSVLFASERSPRLKRLEMKNEIAFLIINRSGLYDGEA